MILTGEHVDADRLITDLVPPTDDTATGHRLRVDRHPLTGAWWQHVDPGDLALAVVVVSTSGRDRKAAEQALSQLATIGSTRHLIVQRTGKQPPAPALSTSADVIPVESAGDTTATRTEAAEPMTPAVPHDDRDISPPDPDRFRAAPGDVGSNAR